MAKWIFVIFAVLSILVLPNTAQMIDDFKLRGLMVSVKLTSDQDDIDKYIYNLQIKGMTGVMVHGMTGEGTTLKIEDRMKLMGKWVEVTRKYNMKVFVNLESLDLSDVYQLAEYAEKLMVDGIFILPDLLFTKNWGIRSPVNF